MTTTQRNPYETFHSSRQSRVHKKTRNRMLEKNFTRHAHVQNFRRGINELPAIGQKRPSVKHIKKREVLMLKGQSDELNASMGSDHSSVYRKANEKITGKLSIGSSSGDSPTLRKQSHIKLQFKTPLAESLIKKARNTISSGTSSAKAGDPLQISLSKLAQQAELQSSQ